MKNLLHFFTGEYPTWEDLNRLGKSRILQSSYIWLLVVPIVAKGLNTIKDPIHLKGLGEGLYISLTLPFSWKLFYFSAVVISIAGLIYTLSCPELIRRFNTFSDYMGEGRGTSYLTKYVNSRKIDVGYPTQMSATGETVIIRDDVLNQAFWLIFAHENHQRRWSRSFCFSFYLIGLLMIAIVFLQNFLFVVDTLI